MKTQILTPPLYFITSQNICFLISVSLVTACSVFKEKSFFQTDSLHKQNSRREIKTKESTQVNAVRIYNHQNSTDNQSFTEIFPEGNFNYSVKHGFQGTAKRVVINERVKAGTKIRDSAVLSGTNNTVLNVTETERQLTQAHLKMKAVNTKKYALWYLTGVFLIFIAVFAFRRKLTD